MKKFGLILISIFLYLKSDCQETKFVYNTGESFDEEYYVLKNNENIKHGTYVKYIRTQTKIGILETGNYSNGLKEGIWEMFSSQNWNSIQEKGPYLNGKKNGIWYAYYVDNNQKNIKFKTYDNKNKTDSASLEIEHNGSKIKSISMYFEDQRVGEWQYFDKDGNLLQKYDFSTDSLILDRTIPDSILYSKNRNPIFWGGETNLFNIINANRNFLLLFENQKEDSSKLIIEINVDTNGKTKNIKVNSSLKDKVINNKLIALIKLTDDYWLPGIRDGKATELAVKIIFDINVSSNEIVSSMHLE